MVFYELKIDRFERVCGSFLENEVLWVGGFWIKNEFEILN